MSLKRSQGTTPGLGSALVGAYSGSVLGTDTHTPGTRHTFTLPSISAGYLMVVFYESRNSTTTGPSGYTERFAQDLGTDEWTYVWTKEAVGSETETTLTGSGLDTTTGVIVLGGDYYDMASLQSAQNNPSLPGLSDQYMLAAFMANYTSTPWTTMPGVFGTSWTTHFNVSGTSTDLMVVGRDVQYTNVTSPYIAGGGGGVGNQYQVALTVLVSSP